MKMKTKLFSAVLSVAMIATAFASCNGNEAKEVASIDDLKGATVGVQLGTTGDIYVSDDEYKDAGTVVNQFKTGFEAVNALKSNKLDAVVIDNEPAKAFVAKNDDLKILDEPFADEEYAICVAKENTELRDKINTALNELIADGTVEKIVRNYIADETSGETVPYQYTSPEGISRDNGVLKMATNAAFPPYESVETNDKGENMIVGIDADIALAIADKLGMTLEIENLDFDALLTAVASGKADMVMAGMTVTEERQQSVLFTDPYCTAKQVIIVKK